MFVVTGANGFIGSVLVRELNSRGISDIIAVDIVSPNERPGPLDHAQIKSFQLTPDFLRWAANIENAKTIKAIFHMGAISSTTEANWDKLYENNIVLSQKLFEICDLANVPFIYASSGAVYGLGENGFSDQTPAQKFSPLNLYGRSKKEFDIWLETQRPKIRYYGLRFFNVYGPNEYHKGEMSSVVFKAFHQILSTKKLKLFKSAHPDYKDGEQLRDFIYVKDVTRWMWELYNHKTAPCGIYNMGFGKARTWLDLARNTFLNMNTEAHIDWIEIPASIKNQYQYFTEADMTKWNALQLSPATYNLESGIKDYIQNHLQKKDPNL